MKNFRKSIIALATAAAMLIPSVAMAATLTTTVDKDIDGDVYVGFYDGAVLKDVVKTTVADATVTDAAAAEATELPCTVTITDEVRDDATHSDSVTFAPTGEVVRKLVFTANVARPAVINQFNIIMSYDNTVVQPVTADAGPIDWDYSWHNDGDEMSRPFSICQGYTYNTRGAKVAVPFSSPGTQYLVKSNRTGLSFNQAVTTGGAASYVEDLVLMEFYYRVLPGQTVTADTFRIETDLNGEFLSTAGFASPGSENGIRLYNPDGGYTYGCWSNGAAVADSIALVTPWDVQEVTTKTLSVDVPAGAEGYAATMFIWDENQIAQCDPINF